jgi:TolB protein
MLYTTENCRRAFQYGAALALTLGAIGLPARHALTQTEKKASDERILFVSDRDKADEFAIFSMNPDGSGQARLSKGERIAFDPAWSPDHKQILFSRVTSAEKRTTSLCVMKADGSDPIVLVPDQEQIIYTAPSWSPDGKNITYSAVHTGGKFASDIYIMDSSGKNSKKIVEGVVSAWTPDGKHLVYSSISNSMVPELKIADVDGSNVKTLAAKGLGPAWSPDGKRIAFTSDNENKPALFIMDADGTHLTLLTKGADTLAIGPVWTPDGKHILFTQIAKDSPDKPQTEVWQIEADGSKPKAVTKSGSLLGPGVSMLFVMRSIGN